MSATSSPLDSSEWTKLQLIISPTIYWQNAHSMSSNSSPGSSVMLPRCHSRNWNNLYLLDIRKGWVSKPNLPVIGLRAGWSDRSDDPVESSDDMIYVILPPVSC